MTRLESCEVTGVDRQAAERFDIALSTRLTGTQLHNLAAAFARHRLNTRATPTPSPDAERYRHKARGTEYDLIGTAELQDAAGNGVEEGALLAIYRGDDGKLWARRHSEFGDGRFEKVGRRPSPALAAITALETGELKP